MTMSFISFEKSDETKKTSGYWCNDGMILIIQKRHDDKNEWGGTSCHLKPSELKKIIETYREDATEPLLDIQEVRPGLMPVEEKVKVTVRDKLIVIDNKFRMFSPDFFSKGELTLTLEDAKEMLKGCCETRDGYEKDIGIAPLLGFNCRAEEREVVPCEGK
jgi:hypothetical protein